jgi:hypothetical protein
VWLPRLAWVTRRPARSRAYHDLIQNFWSWCAVLTCPRGVARYIRFGRRKTYRWTCLQGMACQATIRDEPCVLAHGL